MKRGVLKTNKVAGQVRSRFFDFSQVGEFMGATAGDRAH